MPCIETKPQKDTLFCDQPVVNLNCTFKRPVKMPWPGNASYMDALATVGRCTGRNMKFARFIWFLSVGRRAQLIHVFNGVLILSGTFRTR